LEQVAAAADLPSASRRIGVRAGRALRVACLLALSGLPALFYLRPVWAAVDSQQVGRSADPVFNLYVLKWGVHQLRLGLPDFWNANFFYPERGVLAFSDHLAGPAAQLLLLLELGLVPNAVAGYNLLLASSFVLSAAATCWVLRRSGRSWVAAILGGWMYAFAPVRWAHLEHIQILLAQWIPLTLWCWDRLLAEVSWKRAAAFLPFSLLHLTGGCYLAYMIHLPMLALLASRAAADWRRLVSPHGRRVLGAVAVPAVLLIGLLFAPYAATSHRHGMARSADEVALYSATLPSYLAPSETNLYAPLWHRLVDRWHLDALSYDESRLFAGFLASALCVGGLLTWLRRYRAPAARPLAAWQQATLAALLALAAAALLLGDLVTLGVVGLAGDWNLPALGLALGLGLWLAARRAWGGNWPLHGAAMDPWERGLALAGLACLLLSLPLVFVPLTHVVPGLANLRAPGRFYVFTSLAITWFAALGLDGLLPAARRPRLLLSSAVALMLTLELAPAAIAMHPLRDEPSFPEAYRYLGAAADVRALVELPIVTPRTEALYMYYSTLHWKPLANGYSGFLPRSYLELRGRMPLLPERDGFELLRARGITHLVAHCRGIDNRPLRARLPSWEQEFLGGQVELVFTAGGDRIYRLRPLRSSR
jgi:hypothetical protein